MGEYKRPMIEIPQFVDADGNVIPYGDRWDMTTEDPVKAPYYSVTEHPERFAPLVEVADALIEWLDQTFVVDVQTSAQWYETCNSEYTWDRIVRVEPSSPVCASIGFGITTLPSVVLHIGEVTEMAYPECGCDACDASVEQLMADLEARVIAVTDGRFQEWVTHSEVTSQFEDVNGCSQSGHSIDRRKRRQFKKARQRLAEMPDGWQPWPRR